jgi:hypothetical protein
MEQIKCLSVNVAVFPFVFPFQKELFTKPLMRKRMKNKQQLKSLLHPDDSIYPYFLLNITSERNATKFAK